MTAIDKVEEVFAELIDRPDYVRLVSSARRMKDIALFIDEHTAGRGLNASEWLRLGDRILNDIAVTRKIVDAWKEKVL